MDMKREIGAVENNGINEFSHVLILIPKSNKYVIAFC